MQCTVADIRQLILHAPLQVFTSGVRGLGDSLAAVKISGMHESHEARLHAGVHFSHEAYSLWHAGAEARADAVARGSGQGNVAALHGCLFAPPEQGLTVPVGLLMEHCGGAPPSHVVLSHPLALLEVSLCERAAASQSSFLNRQLPKNVSVTADSEFRRLFLSIACVPAYDMPFEWCIGSAL